MSSQRTAIVTGGSQGLGRAVVEALAAAGWNVVTDARHAGELRAATAGLGECVVAVPGDLTDPAHRQELATAAVSVGGGVDLLVNNAGGLGPSPLPALSDYPLDALRELFDINVTSALGLVQLVLPHLRPDGAIVNVTSDASVEAYPGWGGYGATKAALDHLGRVLAVERPDLRVLTVDPGDMRTDMHQLAFPGEDISDRPLPEEVVPRLLALIDGADGSGRYRMSAAEVS